MDKFESGATEIIPFHFDVPGNYLPLRTFLETASQAEAVVTSFNDKFFEGKLQYELLVLPPEPGTFLSKFAILVVLGGLWHVLESDMGKAFVKGLTGYEPAHWTEIAGERVREKLVLKDTTSAEKNDELQRHSEAIIVAESVKGFFKKDNEELTKVGISVKIFRDAYEARNIFYQICSENAAIRGVGFSETDEFPIKRPDFARLQVVLPPKESEPDENPWHVSIATLTVTSPNWDQNDTQRLWKAKDSYGRDRYFKIEDEGFWSLVKDKKLSPHIMDTLKVQWAFHIYGSRMRELRVLRVLEYNDNYIADPLEGDTLDTLLGPYDENSTDGSLPDLFDG